MSTAVASKPSNETLPPCCAGRDIPLEARCSNCLRLHLDSINAQLKKAPSIFKFFYSRQALRVQSILLDRCLHLGKESVL